MDKKKKHKKKKKHRKEQELPDLDEDDYMLLADNLNKGKKKLTKF